jgi:hypothetical protein
MNLSRDQKAVFAGIFVMKVLDLDPKEGGATPSVDLPNEWAPLEPVLERLAIEGAVDIDRKKGVYRLSKNGVQRIGALIDEAESYIDEFDELDTEEMLEILQLRPIDPMRVRFLWGWYQGEFDDLVAFQQRRGLDPVNYDWADYLLSDAFYAEIASDFLEESD